MCHHHQHHLFFLIFFPCSTLSKPLNLTDRSSHLRLCEVQSTLQGRIIHSLASTLCRAQLRCPSSVQRCLFHGLYRSHRIAVDSVVAPSLLCRSPSAHPSNSSDMSEELSNANNKSACGYFNRFLWFPGCRRPATCLSERERESFCRHYRRSWIAVHFFFFFFFLDSPSSSIPELSPSLVFQPTGSLKEKKCLSARKSDQKLTMMMIFILLLLTTCPAR